MTLRVLAGTRGWIQVSAAREELSFPSCLRQLRLPSQNAQEWEGELLSLIFSLS